MNIKPVTGPGAIPPNGTPEHVRTARALDAFNKGVSSYDKQSASAASQQTGQAPVNQNAVSVEELGAIQAPTEEAPELEATAVVPEETIAEPEKPKEDPALSRQFAQLARQERALRAQKQQFQTEMKAKEAELNAKLAALEQQAKPAPDLSNYVSIDDLKRDTYGTLQRRAGITYDEITRQAMEYQPVNPQVQAMLDAQQAKIDQLLALNETSQKTQQEQQQTQYQSALRQIETDVTNLVKSDPTTFEAIAKTGKASIKEVVKLIEETYNKDGYVMDIETAAKEVEDYLVEQSIKTVSRIEKIKKQLNQAPAVPKKADVKTPPQQKPQMKTLTNATSSSRQLSAKERAILAFKGELKD